MKDFRKSVIYQIYPKSFYDTNGDGLGDLPGVTAKLDYLQALGVDYIWMTPFFVSPQRDNGYDVADYCRIDPRFGTMEDFETLCREAKARGIRVMLDMVFNHTSTQHEWFQKALAGAGGAVPPRPAALLRSPPNGSAHDGGVPPARLVRGRAPKAARPLRGGAALDKGRKFG